MQVSLSVGLLFKNKKVGTLSNVLNKESRNLKHRRQSNAPKPHDSYTTNGIINFCVQVLFGAAVARFARW